VVVPTADPPWFSVTVTRSAGFASLVRAIVVRVTVHIPLMSALVVSRKSLPVLGVLDTTVIAMVSKVFPSHPCHPSIHIRSGSSPPACNCRHYIREAVRAVTAVVVVQPQYPLSFNCTAPRSDAALHHLQSRCVHIIPHRPGHRRHIVSRKLLSVLLVFATRVTAIVSRPLPEPSLSRSRHTGSGSSPPPCSCRRLFAKT